MADSFPSVFLVELKDNIPVSPNLPKQSDNRIFLIIMIISNYYNQKIIVFYNRPCEYLERPIKGRDRAN
jgi:hypothetical protein